MKPDPHPRLPVREIDQEMVESVAYYTEHFVSSDLTEEETLRELHELLVSAERAHREALEDWLRRYTLEGSEHRLHRRMKKMVELPTTTDKMFLLGFKASIADFQKAIWDDCFRNIKRRT